MRPEQSGCLVVLHGSGGSQRQSQNPWWGAKKDHRSPTLQGKLRYASPEMNRSPFVPPAAAAAPRFPSGWRARLTRDPIPLLLREGPPALAARVRRELIDDD